MKGFGFHDRKYPAGLSWKDTENLNFIDEKKQFVAVGWMVGSIAQLCMVEDYVRFMHTYKRSTVI